MYSTVFTIIVCPKYFITSRHILEMPAPSPMIVARCYLLYWFFDVVELFPLAYESVVYGMGFFVRCWFCLYSFGFVHRIWDLLIRYGFLLYECRLFVAQGHNCSRRYSSFLICIPPLVFIYVVTIVCFHDIIIFYPGY